MASVWKGKVSYQIWRRMLTHPHWMRLSTNKRGVRPKLLMPPDGPPADQDETPIAWITSKAARATIRGNRWRPDTSRRHFHESAAYGQADSFRIVGSRTTLSNRQFVGALQYLKRSPKIRQHFFAVGPEIQVIISQVLE